MTAGECTSCGSHKGETPFPATKRRGAPLLCCDCLAETLEPPRSSLIQRRKIITRRKWRARLRARSASPQLDLVDLAMRQ